MLLLFYSLVYIELCLTVSALAMRFDFRLDENKTCMDDIQLESDGYMPIMKRQNGVWVFVSERDNKRDI